MFLCDLCACQALTLELDDSLTFFKTRGPDQQLEHLEKLSVSRTRLPRPYPSVPLTPEELAVVERIKVRGNSMLLLLFYQNNVECFSLACSESDRRR